MGMVSDRVSHGRRLAALLALSLVGFAPQARADLIQVSITVDNSYALYTGNYSGATTYVGTDGNWPTVETYNFELPSSAYLYVVTASDQSVAQGFLGQFNNLTTGYKFYSSDPQWQVVPTGLGSAAPYSGTLADLALLSSQIQLANTASSWSSFTAGGANGSGPWNLMPGIDAAAHWVWYAGGNCNTVNPTLGGCNAGEWLIFRIGVAATPNVPIPPPPTTGVPEPGTLLLVGTALLGLGGRLRRSSKRRA